LLKANFDKDVFYLLLVKRYEVTLHLSDITTITHKDLVTIYMYILTGR